MKNYKNYPQMRIGGSDYASLTVRTPQSVSTLDFGEDGEYSAYVIPEDTEIGEHYKKVLECEGWVKIYDDVSLSFEAKAEKIEIFRAGMRGCIIKLTKGDYCG